MRGSKVKKEGKGPHDKSRLVKAKEGRREEGKDGKEGRKEGKGGREGMK